MRLFEQSIIRIGLAFSTSILVVGCGLLFSGDEVSFETIRDAEVDNNDSAHPSSDLNYRRAAFPVWDGVSSVDESKDPGERLDAEVGTTSIESGFDATQTDDTQSENETERDSAVDTGTVEIDDDAGGTSLCGNGETEKGEDCDDGNTAGGDGCSKDCTSIESEFICVENSDDLSICTACTMLVDQDAVSLRQDGKSWTTALKDLRIAVEEASRWIQDERCATVELWVAAGRYIPTSDKRREFSFSLHNNVAVYGGFSGGEWSRDQRDWKNNTTILSGDLEGNDGTSDDGTASDRSDNSYHVVKCEDLDTTAVLDGFSIMGGRADLGPETGTIHHSGGGIYGEKSSPTLVNLIIRDNFAVMDGGGMFNKSECSPILRNVEFSNNEGFYGGAMNSRSGSDPQLTDVVFIENTAAQGGGMFNMSNANPKLYNVLFYRNHANGLGGGIVRMNYYTLYTEPAIYHNVRFIQNTANAGGGLSEGPYSRFELHNAFFSQNSSVNGGAVRAYFATGDISDVTFRANQSSNVTSREGGGGVYSYYSTITIKNAVFMSNFALTSGGGIFSTLDEMVVSNSLFIGNTTGESGGGIANFDNGQITLVNVTLTENRADEMGGAVYISGTESDLTLMNSILWNNGSEVYTEGMVDARYCAIEGGIEGTGIIESGPIFRNPQMARYGCWTDVTYDTTTDRTVFTDSTASWQPGELSDEFVKLDAEIEGGLVFALIQDNTATEIWVEGDLTELVTDGFDYEFYDFRLHPSSPCIDAGNDLDAPDLDICGMDRIDITSIANCQTEETPECDWCSDIGVFEYHDNSQE